MGQLRSAGGMTCKMIFGVFVLAHDVARRRAIEAVRLAPAGAEVKIKDPTRTSEQNAKLHAMLSDVASQLRHHGETLSIDDWKDLLVPAWYKATDLKPRILPNLDGDGFAMMYRSTARMGKKQLSELIDFIDAWGSQQGVVWSYAE